MPSKKGITLDLVQRAKRFRFIYEYGGSVFAVNEICDLTGFCVPLVRRRRGFYAIDYELGIMVVNNEIDAEKKFRENIEKGRYVVLRRTIPAERSLEMVIGEEGISDWMLNDMNMAMSKYCLAKMEALSLLQSPHDEFVSEMKAVYGEEFEICIIKPLIELSD